MSGSGILLLVLNACVRMRTSKCQGHIKGFFQGRLNSQILDGSFKYGQSLDVYYNLLMFVFAFTTTNKRMYLIVTNNI